MCATSVQSESRHRSARVARELHDPNDVADKYVLGKTLNRGIHPPAILEGEHGTASLDRERDTHFIAVVIPDVRREFRRGRHERCDSSTYRLFTEGKFRLDHRRAASLISARLAPVAPEVVVALVVVASVPRLQPRFARCLCRRTNQLFLLTI
jgi:hypothetical protein